MDSNTFCELKLDGPSNIYSLSVFSSPSKSTLSFFVSTISKVYEIGRKEDGPLSSFEISLPSLPASADIIGIDAFVNSKGCVTLGVTMAQYQGENRPPRTWFHVYILPELAPAEIVHAMELQFVPLKLTHVDRLHSPAPSESERGRDFEDAAFVLFGTDRKAHVFALSHHQHQQGPTRLVELDAHTVCPQFCELPSSVLAVDSFETQDHWFYATGCQNGFLRICKIPKNPSDDMKFQQPEDSTFGSLSSPGSNSDSENGGGVSPSGTPHQLSMSVMECDNAFLSSPVNAVKFFQSGDSSSSAPSLHLLVSESVGRVALFSDVGTQGLDGALVLPKSDSFDSTTCLGVQQGEGGVSNLLVGTYSGKMLKYTLGCRSRQSSSESELSEKDGTSSQDVMRISFEGYKMFPHPVLTMWASSQKQSFEAAPSSSTSSGEDSVVVVTMYSTHFVKL